MGKNMIKNKGYTNLKMNSFIKQGNIKVSERSITMKETLELLKNNEVFTFYKSTVHSNLIH